MKYRHFGNTGLKVSEVGFGAWAIGGNQHGNSYGPTLDEESIAAVKRAFQLGCNFYDAADVYGWGHSEQLLGKALEDVRENCIIATKVGGDFYHGGVRTNFSRDYIHFAVEKSLERIHTAYIDLYQLHNPTLEMIRDGKVFEPMRELKEAGKIRFWGVSIHAPIEGIEAIRVGKPDAIQVVYNLFRQEAAEALFDHAKREGVAIIAREPLANGFLTGKYTAASTFTSGDIRHNLPPSFILSRVMAVEMLRFLEKPSRSLAQAALRFVLDNDAVSVVIPGAKHQKQVEENVGASELEPLSKEETERIARLYRNNFYSS